MIRRPPRSTHCISSAASDVYKRQHQPCGTPHPRGGPARPPSVLTPLVPLHYSTCGEGKGALPSLFYATAAMMLGHAQLHMNPVTLTCSEGRGSLLRSGWGIVHAGTCKGACVQARSWGYPSLPYLLHFAKISCGSDAPNATLTCATRVQLTRLTQCMLKVYWPRVARQ